MLAFLKMEQGKTVKGWYECENCDKAAVQAFVVEGQAVWTCDHCGHENKQ
jgi:ribosomal protein L37AE/L43A